MIGDDWHPAPPVDEGEENHWDLRALSQPVVVSSNGAPERRASVPAARLLGRLGLAAMGLLTVAVFAVSGGGLVVAAILGVTVVAELSGIAPKGTVAIAARATFQALCSIGEWVLHGTGRADPGRGRPDFSR